jgi:AcrR family transcriptional regulator
MYTCQVTARAGVSPNALYLHFEDKSALVRAVIAERFEDLRRELAVADAAHDGDPPAQLRAQCDAYIAFGVRHPGHYRLVFETRSGSNANLRAGGRAAFALLQTAVTRCLDDEREPRTVALVVWSGLHGFVVLRRSTARFGWPAFDVLVDELLAAQLGITRRSPR